MNVDFPRGTQMEPPSSNLSWPMFSTLSQRTPTLCAVRAELHTAALEGRLDPQVRASVTVPAPPSLREPQQAQCDDFLKADTASGCSAKRIVLDNMR